MNSIINLEIEGSLHSSSEELIIKDLVGQIEKVIFNPKRVFERSPK